jgi:hypothetical protein
VHQCISACMLPRLHSDRLGMRLASSKNYQPNAASLSLTMCSPPCTSPASNGPGLVEGPVFWLSSIVCRCRQGLPSRSESRIARTDRGYYWKISAELNSLVLLLCLSTSCAVSTHRIGLAHIHHPLRSATGTARRGPQDPFSSFPSVEAKQQDSDCV